MTRAGSRYACAMTSKPSGGGLGRRHFLGLGATLGAATLSACASRPAIQTRRPSTYVLVHGAWHGGWCWRYVRRELESVGHRVLSPTLTGLGERAHLMSAEISLETHIKDVAGVIETEELQSVILVGHSYGGMVITGVADGLKNRISHIVYLDAALPEDGQTMLTQGPQRSRQEIAASETALRSLSSDGVTMRIPDVRIFGVEDATEGQIAWLERRLTPHPLKTWFDPIRLEQGGPAGLPGTYIHCTSPIMQNTSFGYHAERLRSQSDWTVLELETGHNAMISAPTDLAKLLNPVSE